MSMTGPAAHPSLDDATPFDEARALFGSAFREHHRSLMAHLRHRLGNEAEAADIAQEAYLRLLRYHKDQDLDSLKALLFRIATNLVLMRNRAARVRRQDGTPLDASSPLAGMTLPLEQQVSAQQQLDKAMAVIMALPEKCRQVFVLSRFHGLSYPQIAARCGISVKMVEKHITRALAACRQGVGGEWP